MLREAVCGSNKNAYLVRVPSLSATSNRFTADYVSSECIFENCCATLRIVGDASVFGLGSYLMIERKSSHGARQLSSKLDRSLADVGRNIGAPKECGLRFRQKILPI